jgi:oligoribonuclease (3'-5' exoribonuclease)
MARIEKLLAIDVETSGFSKGDDVAHNHQIVSIGLIVADRNFMPIDELYIEIKWNGISHWSSSAERIHGLTKQHLEENGLDEEDAVIAIAEFILKHYEPEEYIFFLGHNVKSFDVPFFNKLMNKYDVSFNIAYRTIDSLSVGFTCLDADDSNEIFSYFYSERKEHNALEDARMSLGVCRNIRKLMQATLNG